MPGRTLPVSVVITAYNAEPWLERCLRSIRAGTVLPAEIIVVDDGSTDATARIASDAGDVTLISQPNAGLPAARNTGIAAASQHWIALLDSDDEWHPRKLEFQGRFLDLRPDLDMIFTDYDEVYESEDRIEPNALSWYWNYPRIARERVADFLFVLEAGSFASEWPRWSFLTPSTVLLRKERILEAGGFTAGMSYCEDYEFFLRFIRNGRVGVVELPLVAYYRHSDQMSADLIRMKLTLIDVQRLVLANPGRYHQESVKTASTLLPELLAETAAAQSASNLPKAVALFVEAAKLSKDRFSTARAYARALARMPRLRLLRQLPLVRDFARSKGLTPSPPPPFSIPWREPAAAPHATLAGSP